jgi:hypothetical protein
MKRPANSVPRGRGVRGAARGLERELKASEQHQKSAIVKVKLLSPENVRPKRSDGPFGRAKYIQFNSIKVYHLHDMASENILQKPGKEYQPLSP